MGRYFTGRRARRYNARWQTFNEKTLGEALAMIDLAALRSVPQRLGRAPRVLDVACGTGILLDRLLRQVPGVEAYGVDASEDMLAQARVALQGEPHIHVERVRVGDSPIAGLPFAQGTFDLVTCTNVLHDLTYPVAALAGLRRVLAQGGQLVLEDFARRERPFPWTAVEWLLSQIEGNSVHAYTLSEAHSLCTQAGLSPRQGRAFKVDWFWRGWVVRAYRTPLARR